MPSLPIIQPGSPTAVIDLIQQLDVGEVRLSDHDRLLYSTDASLYQVKPLAVVIPKTLEQIANLLQFCREHRIAVLPRGGGTSLAGQCTAEAIVLDLSPHFRNISEIDLPRACCRVQAGASLDELNRTLASTGLFFAPDPATTAQATIGGCIGNNAAGARSIIYGRTSENIASIEIMLASGERITLGPGAGKLNVTAARLATGVAKIVRAHAALIREKIPRLVRRNAGYGLDLILDQIEAGVTDEDLDLTGLLCGSEGTLAITLSAQVKLMPIPQARALAIVSFDSVDSAIASVPAILTTGPSAVELLDDVVLEAARGNLECSRYLELLPRVDGAMSAAVLYVEYQTEQLSDDLQASFDRLKRCLTGASIVVHRDRSAIQSAWALRKAGEALLHGLSSAAKPVTFVEDNSIPVENLARFVKEFRGIVQSHGTEAAFYAHASVGVLHVRPMLNLRTPAGLKSMQEIAVQIANLARDCGGVMSGEHGDGKARGPLLMQLYGPELMDAFAQVKRVFDPLNLLNPGNIVNAGPVESITQNLRLHRESNPNSVEAVETFFNYDDQEGFQSAVEMCNGAGFCRKTAGGSMCPSYRATLDERHSTRGRGNALRLAITGQASKDQSANWNDSETMATLDLCLSCKACKTECPSNVDISRLKAEYTAQRFERTGKPLSARVFGHIRLFNRLGAMMPALSNWCLKQKLSRWIARKVLNVSAHRTLPAVGHSLLRWYQKQSKPNVGQMKVVLYADCFTTYNEPEIGRAAIKVLQRLGYQVLLPDPGCCGRSMISVGLLPDAIVSADRAISVLSRYLNDPEVCAIVFCEPSCLSAIKDDWLQLKLKAPIELRRTLAKMSLLVEDFVASRWDQHPVVPANLKKGTQPICLHGHCHQKALWGVQTSSNILQNISSNVEVLDSGCCGMAGAFGYAADKYELSMKIGELSVFPPIRSTTDQTIIAAPGTSCRHQIRDGTGKNAVHPIQIVADWFDENIEPRP